MRRLLKSHRDIARVTRRIPLGPNAMEANERILAMLRGAVFPIGRRLGSWT